MSRLQPVLSDGRSSAAIAKIGWHKDVLAVEFTSGLLYAYKCVPRSVYIEFLGADSKGQFFHNDIRNGDFDYQQCESVDELLGLLELDSQIQSGVDPVILAAKLFSWLSIPQGDAYF